MRKPPKRLCAALALLLALLVCALPAAAQTEADPEADTQAEASPDPEVSAEPQGSASAGDAVLYVGEIATRAGENWECAKSYAVKSATRKAYDTMEGNVLHLRVYSTVPQDDASGLYLPMDSHISFIDDTDRFTLTGRSGAYYCYEKAVRVTAAGSFELAVASVNQTLYSGLYDTVEIRAYPSVETLGIYAESDAGDPSVTHFFVTANGSDTALITADTLGFNSTDNEWKIVTAENTEKVLFDDTAYNGYTFAPQITSLSITAGAEAQVNPTTIRLYYLGLVNGKLFTVGPYLFPASATTYSSTFELGRTSVDVLDTDGSVSFPIYVEAGRRPELTISDAQNRTSLAGMQQTDSDQDGMDCYTVTVNLEDTAADFDLLVGNRWSVNQIAYNYRTLRLHFLHGVTSLSVTAGQTGNYHVDYAAAVNGNNSLDTGAINWYLNGVLQSEHGTALSRTYQQGGTYAVYAELGGMQSNTVTSTIIYSDAQAVLWYLAGLGVLALAVLLALRRRRWTGKQQDARMKRQLEHLLQEARDARAGLNAEKITPEHTMDGLRRIDRRLSFLCDSAAARGEETGVSLYREVWDSLSWTQNLLRQVRPDARPDAYYARAMLDTCIGTLGHALERLNDAAALSAH